MLIYAGEAHKQTEFKGKLILVASFFKSLRQFRPFQLLNNAQLIHNSSPPGAVLRAGLQWDGTFSSTAKPIECYHNESLDVGCWQILSLFCLYEIIKKRNISI